MRKIIKIAVAVIGVLTLAASSASAVVGPQPGSTTTSPDILITSIVGGSALQDLEVYNQSDSPINLSGWSFTFTIKDAGSCNAGQTASPINFPSGWMLSKDYLTFENNGTDSSADIFNVDPSFTAVCSSPWLSAIQIFDNGNVEQTVNIPDNTNLINGAQQKQRGNSPSSTRTVTGTFTSDYTVAKSPINLFSDPLYAPPAGTNGLEIVEILPNSLNCGPTDPSLLCSDYVKLFNSSSSPVDMSGYRLRTSYDGLSSTSSNTVDLNGALAPGAYSLVNTKNSGDPLSLTDTGGYVWLEDAYGTEIYQPVINYPDASSAADVGQSWALNGTTWQWSSSPQPSGANYFPSEATTGGSLSTTSTLTPCKAGQERNPLTNRCDSLTTASSVSASSQPCPAGQERNPATNRCRSTTTTGTTLKACTIGQARNPATNRCRKISATDVAKIQDIKTPGGASQTKWYIVAAIILAALAYAVYEWSQEIKLFLEKLKAKLPGFIVGKTKI